MLRADQVSLIDPHSTMQWNCSDQRTTRLCTRCISPSQFSHCGGKSELCHMRYCRSGHLRVAKAYGAVRCGHFLHRCEDAMTAKLLEELAMLFNQREPIPVER